MNGLEISESSQGHAVSGVGQPIPDTHNDVFIVRVTRFDDVWLAECDRLGLVTEADGYAALEDRARSIAPELAEMNGLGVSGWPIRIQFQMMDPSGDSDLG